MQKTCKFCMLKIPDHKICIHNRIIREFYNLKVIAKRYDNDIVLCSRFLLNVKQYNIYLEIFVKGTLVFKNY